jgi:calcineurin-like phosphoesterase
MPLRFEPATDDARLGAVIVEADDATGKAKSISRIMAS